MEPPSFTRANAQQSLFDQIPAPTAPTAPTALTRTYASPDLSEKVQGVKRGVLASDSPPSTPILSDVSDDEPLLSKPRKKVAFDTPEGRGEPKPRPVKIRTSDPIERVKPEHSKNEAKVKLVSKAEKLVAEYLNGNYELHSRGEVKKSVNPTYRSNLQEVSLRGLVARYFSPNKMLEFAEILALFKNSSKLTLEDSVELLSLFHQIPSEERSLFSFDLSPTTLKNLCAQAGI